MFESVDRENCALRDGARREIVAESLLFFFRKIIEDVCNLVMNFFAIPRIDTFYGRISSGDETERHLRLVFRILVGNESGKCFAEFLEDFRNLGTIR